MKIIGSNLGEVEASLKRLSAYNWNLDEKQKRIIKYLEEQYLELFNEEKPVKQLKQSDNGLVIIESGMLNHRCHADMENLRNISKFGILASEWFGLLEAEQEGCFCSFISRMKGENYKGGKGDLAEDDYSRLNIGKNVLLFFDETNDVMKQLLHLDYFEFCQIKASNPNYQKLYTKEELEILEDLIEPLSPSGRKMRKQFESKTNYWSAIPGGIPPFLINGVCIKKNNFTDAELDEMSTLFPNATIFNNKLEVLRYPKTKVNLNKKMDF